MLKQLVSRENASSDVDLSVRAQHALVEVDVCVAPEPLGLHEGSSRVCRMVVACRVVGTVAAGCAWARFTAFPVSLQSDHFFSLYGLLALQLVLRAVPPPSYPNERECARAA